MGLTITVALALIVIIIAAIVYIYNKNIDYLFPPYQEPVKKCPFGLDSEPKQGIDPNWPFPSGPKP
jgi:hypothetical protein